MAKYTIEDVEILRQKSGLSYEEAVNLLEYHNGSLAQALLDLEKNGRLNTQPNASAHKGPKGAKGIFDFLYRLRLVVRKGEITVVNLSALFVLITLGTAPHICIIGLIAGLAMGYRFTIDRNSNAFAKETFDDIVKNAKTNMHSFAQQFTEQEASKAEEPVSKPRSESAPRGTRPVNVPVSDEGSVDVHESSDGYHEADIQ